MFTQFLVHGAEMWSVTGWTMLHYLWLGAMVGAVAMVCRQLVRRASADVRYAVALVNLAVLVLLPVAIAGWLIATSQAIHVSEGIAVPTSRPEVNPTIDLNGTSAGRSDATISGVAVSDSAPMESNAASRGFPLDVRRFEWLTMYVPYLPWLWLVGTPLTFVLLATGVIGAERLRRGSYVLDEGPIAERCIRLRRSLGVTRQVAVALCERIATPVLVGIVRPIILLPPSALTGWSPDEIEMVLLHELAHVRRWDNLVNLIQRLIESLLFFHPAVWLVSGWVRQEREACCDALVVNRTQRPHAYAEMLVALAAQMPRSVLFHPVASSAMAASPLRARIRRVLQLEDDPMLVSGKSISIVLGGLLVTAVLGVLYLPTIGQAEESTTEATEGIDEALTDAAAEEESQKNLKRLIMALHINDAYHKSLPPNAIYDADGKPLLSWRVHVLPFLAEEKLYRDFHLDEPWDSEHNRKLIDRMPDVFKNPKLDRPGMTNYLAVVGKECVFDGSPKGIRLWPDVSDGTANTIAIVEADPDRAVQWTKPEDWEFDRRRPTDGLGSLWSDRWYAAWADGSVRCVNNREPADKVGINFTRAGREVHSLKESEGRVSQGGMVEGGVMAGEAGLTMDLAAAVAGESGAEGEMRMAAGEAGMGRARGASQFPTLEEQKLADLAYRRLGLEMEPIEEEDLQRVKALGYDGGLKVAAGAAGTRGNVIQTGDILVGLHVWPTTSMQALAEVLERDDLAELNPLKFYVVRYGTGVPNIAPTGDHVVTGRVSITTTSGLGNPDGSGTSRSSTWRQSGPSPTEPYVAGDSPDLDVRRGLVCIAIVRGPIDNEVQQLARLERFSD